MLGKIIGGVLGWAFTGGTPIGAIIGVALGSLVDGGNLKAAGFSNKDVDSFSASLLVLSAAVMKADGKILKSELNYVRSFLVKEFGADKASKHVKLLQNILKQEIPVRQVCMQIRSHLSHAQRLQLLHYLFGIAQSDGSIDHREHQTIHTIARYLGISDQDFLSIEAMFGFNKSSGRRNTTSFKQSVDTAYQILEVDKSATDDEVKKAYRKMAKKYHPDRLGDLSEDLKKSATAKFQKVQEAYEQIQDARGMK